MLNHQFPSDEKVRESLSKLGMARNNPFIRYILFKIDHQMTDQKYIDTQRSFEEELTIEHVMPINWEQKKENWSTPPAGDRNDCLQSIGNLTLLNAYLNQEVGNWGFERKKQFYDRHTSLSISRDILDYDSWDVPQIRKREKELSDLFIEIWKSADCFLKTKGEAGAKPIEMDPAEQVYEGVLGRFSPSRGEWFHKT